MNVKKNILNLASVYTAVVLGAGFASGQEILSFFVKYGSLGFVGLLISGVVFSMVGIATLSICFDYKIKSYSHFFSTISSKSISIFMELICTIFLIVIFSTMLSATGATVKQMFNFDFTIGVIIACIFCFVIFKIGVKAIVEINTFLAPIMAFGGIFIGLYTFFSEYTPVFANGLGLSVVKDNWMVSSITYSSYNMLTCIAVLISLSKIVINKKVAVWGGVIGGLSITIIGVCISLPLFINFNSLSGVEIPMLKITESLGSFINYFYLLVFLCAIFTTAISSGYTFSEGIASKFNLHEIPAKLITCFIGAIFSHIGFSGIVTTVYPIFGIIGFIQIVLILFFYFAKYKVSFKIPKKSKYIAIIKK